MSIAKGLAYSIVGAALASAAWVGLIRATGLDLWILAPVIGGAAGYGMMRATRMKGGLPAGALAAAVTIVAIFGARSYVSSAWVQEYLVATEEDALDVFASQVAAELEADDVSPYDDEGDYLPAVYQAAESRWSDMSEAQQHQYLAAMTQEDQPAAAALTPLALLFDFGLIGTLCAALSAGAAFKTASMTLEQALLSQGIAADHDDAQGNARHLRAADRAPVSSGFSLIPPAPPGSTATSPHHRAHSAADLAPSPFSTTAKTSQDHLKDRRAA